ncbi:MAG: ABC transporter substrate-binding protein [Gammaproteobacteria bacterium]
MLAACSGGPWNNPYPAEDSDRNIYYSSFSERPKHLDPARSYSSNEWAFISQIYEPPLQYHFLKRPYDLVPLTTRSMPEIRYLDEALNPLEAGDERIAFIDYTLTLLPGRNYQPHPAFATGAAGKALYDRDWEGLAEVHTLADFPETGTRELVADDYVYQIKRLAHSRNHSPIYRLLKDNLLGFGELSEKIDAEEKRLQQETGEEKPWVDLRHFDFEGAVVLDRYRFRIRLKQNYPQFRYWLAMNFFAPIPWEADRFYHLPGLEQSNITLHWYPVGTGPYYLAENNPNLRMVLKRNPNFGGEAYPAEGEPGDAEAGLLDDAGEPLPFIDTAVYSLDKESIPRWNKFLQGYYDVSGIGSDSFDQAVQIGAAGQAEVTEMMEEKKIRLQTSVSTSIYYMGFNMLDAVVGGDSERARYLRQAISIALDYEEYISIFANGRGRIAHGPLPMGIYGYRDPASDALGHNPVVYRKQDGDLVRRGIDEAKALLEKAGYRDGIDPATGKSLILYYDVTATGPDSTALLNWYRKQFEKIGIDLVIRTSDYNRFQDKMLKGTAQLFSWGWNADYPDPENFFFLLYGPHARAGEEHGENAANYANPEFDTLFERMKYLPDGEERQQVIDRMIGIVREDAPWVWGFYPVDYALYHDWYSNTKPNLMANNTLKYRRIDPVERDRLRNAWNEPVLWPVILVVVVLLVSLIPAIIVYRRHEKGTAR